jgi:hypothetical protein
MPAAALSDEQGPIQCQRQRTGFPVRTAHFVTVTFQWCAWGNRSAAIEAEALGSSWRSHESLPFQ